MNFKLLIIAAMAAIVVVDGVTVTTSYFADSECKTKATDLTACEAAVTAAKKDSAASITDDCDSSASFSASGAGNCEAAGDIYDKCTAAGLGGSYMIACSANAVFSSVLVVAVAVFANSLF